MKMTSGLMAAVAGLCIAWSGAEAATVYDNGPASGPRAYSIMGTVLADDFTLGAAGVLTGATTNLYGPQWPRQSAQLNYFIFEDAGGKPGVVLASGAAVNATFVSFYGLAFDFASTFQAAANTTYWLGVTGTNPAEPLYVMETKANNSTTLPMGSNGGSLDNWTSGRSELSFSLQGDFGSAVPEPATWAMMIMGFGAAGSMVRNARRRSVPATA